MPRFHRDLEKKIFPYLRSTPTGSPIRGLKNQFASVSHGLRPTRQACGNPTGAILVGNAERSRDSAATSPCFQYELCVIAYNPTTQPSTPTPNPYPNWVVEPFSQLG